MQFLIKRKELVESILIFFTSYLKMTHFVLPFQLVKNMEMLLEEI